MRNITNSLVGSEEQISSRKGSSWQQIQKGPTQKYKKTQKRQAWVYSQQFLGDSLMNMLATNMVDRLREFQLENIKFSLRLIDFYDSKSRLRICQLRF